MKEPSKDYRPISKCIDQHFSKPSSNGSFNVIAELSRHWKEIVGDDLVDCCRIYFFDKEELALICLSSQISFEVQLRKQDILNSVNDFLKEKFSAPFQISSIKTFVDFDDAPKVAPRVTDDNRAKDWQKHALLNKSASVVFEQDEEARQQRAYLTPLALHSDFLTHPSFGQAFDFFR